MADIPFDLFSEAQRNYTHIFPKREEGLVVFELYKKIKLGVIDKNFSHENITDAIEYVDNSLYGKVNKNNSPARDNDIIHLLLTFYILRNSKGYSLRIFAEDLCRLVEEELNARFSPSQVERQLHLFIDALGKAIIDEQSFQIWYHNFFEKNKNQIKKQIEILYNDVDSTIKELNTLYASEDIDFTTKLKVMDLKVQALSRDAKKLEAAFTQFDIIVNQLDEAYGNPQSYACKSQLFREIRMSIRNFFHELETDLIEVSVIIDKIKPQLERLYASFEQRELDRKLEKFTNYIFKTARHEKTINNKEEIALKLIKSPELPAEKNKFQIIVPYKFLDQGNQDVYNTDYNQADHNQQFEIAQAKMVINQKAVYYFNEILAELKHKNKIHYHEYIFRVLESEGSLEVAIKTTHLLFQELTNNPEFDILIEPDFRVSPYNENTSIWETRFQGLNS